MLRPTLALSTLLTLSSAALAGDLRSDLLPAETRWVAHVDVEAFSRTTLWKAVSEEKQLLGTDLQTNFSFEDLEFGDDLPPAVAERIRGLELDLFRDLKSVTLFGTGYRVEGNLAMLEVSSVAHDLLDIARELPGYSRIEVDSIPMHRWVNPERGGEKAICYLRRIHEDGTHVMLFSDDTKRIAQAARVLRGEAEALKRGRRGGLKLAPVHGSFLYFESIEGLPGMDDFGPSSRVTEMVETIRLDVGEREGYLEAHLKVGTSDPREAKDASNVLQGLTSLVALAGPDEPELRAVTQLLDALDFKTIDEEFLIDFEFNSRDLVDLLVGLDEF